MAGGYLDANVRHPTEDSRERLQPRWRCGSAREGLRDLAYLDLAEYHEAVRGIALGLASRGVGRGDVVAMIGDNNRDGPLEMAAKPLAR